jgi:hypothetical protein
MKKALLFSLLLLFVVATNCGGEEEEPYICHLYGYIRNSNTQQGVDSLMFGLLETINPYNINTSRLRYFMTVMQDSMHGYFEIDSVCYGTSKRQGSDLVLVVISDTLSPGWISNNYFIDIDGPVDTVYVDIIPDN